MDEQMEYAEMLEIPVSTVNVVRKKSRQKKSRGRRKELPLFELPLKDSKNIKLKFIESAINNELNINLKN